MFSYFNVFIFIRLKNKNKLNLFKNRDFIFIFENLINRFDFKNDIFLYIIDINIYAM